MDRCIKENICENCGEKWKYVHQCKSEAAHVEWKEVCAYIIENNLKYYDVEEIKEKIRQRRLKNG